MKDINDFILESTQDEDLHEEVGLALKEFGNTKNGFKMSKVNDIIDAMYKLGFDFDNQNQDEDKMIFYGEYMDSKYTVELYVEDRVAGKVKLRSFNVFED